MLGISLLLLFKYKIFGTHEALAPCTHTTDSMWWQVLILQRSHGQVGVLQLPAAMTFGQLCRSQTTLGNLLKTKFSEAVLIYPSCAVIAQNVIYT